MVSIGDDGGILGILFIYLFLMPIVNTYKYQGQYGNSEPFLVKIGGPKLLFVKLF